MPKLTPTRRRASATFLPLAFAAFTLAPTAHAADSTPATMRAEAALMPLPSSLQASTGELTIAPGLTASIGSTNSPRLAAGTLRALRHLEDKTGLPLSRELSAGQATLTIHVTSPENPLPQFQEDESYTLTTTPSSIQIEAATTDGALHALETLIQLTQPGTGSNAGKYIIPAVTIHDTPRFPWRGLMIDCGRHFEPIDVLKRNIDAMAAVKLNVFHWHLTEDQGFRIESKLYPKLTGQGSDGLFYTQDEAKDLVRYAAARGIRVVPEFEMPGHSAAWLFAYPELASGTVPTGIRREFGVSDSAIDPTREETYKFVERFLREMTTIFPDEYIHIGGDETPAPDWKTNPKIQAFMKAHDLKDNDALQAYFNQRVLKILTSLNRRMEGWDEILTPTLPKNIVIQSWRGVESLSKGATEGYQGILSAPYYIDGMQPSEKVYLADPLPADTTLTPDQQKLILGGEVPMWAEQLDQHTIDSRIWPRAAAIAERFWSPQNVRDVDSMYTRLAPVSLELETLGLHHLSQEDASLRDLAGSEDISALHTFAQAFEPVSFGERYEQQKTSQLTPLTNFVDAVRPDPVIRHQLALATKAFLADPAATTLESAQAQATLLHFFTAQTTALPEVQRIIAASPRLADMQTRANQLAALSLTAQDAIRYINTNTPAPTGWKQSALAQIEEAKKPSAVVRFTFLAPLTDLINATK